MGARLLLNGQSAQQAATLVFFFAAAVAAVFTPPTHNLHRQSPRRSCTPLNRSRYIDPLYQQALSLADNALELLLRPPLFCPQLIYTKRSQGPKDKNLVLPVGVASEYSAAVAGNATPKQLSPRPLVREMLLREDIVYTGGNAELEEGGRSEGGPAAGMHHRGHAAEA